MSPLSFAIKLLKEKKWEGGKVQGGGGTFEFVMK